MSEGMDNYYYSVALIEYQTARNCRWLSIMHLAPSQHDRSRRLHSNGDTSSLATLIYALQRINHRKLAFIFITYFPLRSLLIEQLSAGRSRPIGVGITARTQNFRINWSLPSWTKSSYQSKTKTLQIEERNYRLRFPHLSNAQTIIKLNWYFVVCEVASELPVNCELAKLSCRG